MGGDVVAGEHGGENLLEPRGLAGRHCGCSIDQLMKLRAIFGLARVTAGLALGAQAADTTRFTTSLPPTEFSQAGLGRLTSDQLGALDALVRRDLAAAETADTTKHPRAARFSERLRPEERAAAGLDTLTAAELTQLDAAEQKLVPLPRGVWLTAAKTEAPATIYSEPIKRGLEVHGQITLMVAAGSHGYSAYGGGMVVTVDDPAHGMTFAVGYSEVHEKGGYLRRDCRDGYAPFNLLGYGPGLP